MKIILAIFLLTVLSCEHVPVKRDPLDKNFKHERGIYDY